MIAGHMGVLKAQKGSHILVSSKRYMVSRSREVILLLHSVLLRPHLSTASSPGAPAQEEHRPVGANPKEGHKDDQKDGSPLL